MLELRKVSKHFATTNALEAIELPFAAGQTTVVIGPSGCGKSTVLRLLTGLIRPDHGEIRIANTRLTRENLIKMRRRMGYVIQDGGLFPHLSARANIALMARYLGWERAALERRVAELCEITAFPQTALARFPHELSGGQRQRVALMRALMLDPQVLLLDEPLGALDPLIRFELQRDLQEIFQRLQKTVVLVTHDMAEAGFFADDIVLMRAGKVIQRGSVEDLLERPAEEFVTHFMQAQRRTLWSGESATR